MKLLLGADIPRSYLNKLKEEVFDVTDVRDMPGQPIQLHYPPSKSSGVIVLRTHLLSKEEMFRILKEALKQGAQALDKTLVIASKNRLRFHK